MLPKERRIFVAASTVRLEEAFWSSNQQICSRTMGKSNTLDTEIGYDDHIKSCKLHSCLNLVRRQFYLNQWWGVGISTFPAVRSRSWVANSRWPHGDCLCHHNMWHKTFPYSEFSIFVINLIPHIAQDPIWQGKGPLRPLSLTTEFHKENRKFLLNFWWGAN